MAISNETDLLTVEEVAAYLRVAPNTVYRWFRSGKLTGIKIGKEWRVSRQELDNFLLKRSGPTEPASLNSLLKRQINPPEHILVMSSDPTEVYRLQADFFKQGYQMGHRLFIGLWWQQADDVRRIFTDLGLPVAELEAAGRFHMADLRAAYDGGGAEAAVKVWREQAAACNGGILWGSGSHRLSDWGGCEQDLLDFETKLDAAFHQLAVVALCPCVLDPVEKTGFEALLHLVPHHSGALFLSGDVPVLMRSTLG